ncbi:MAG: DUF819 family protein [Bryobacterales bacterium]|nr:DUF819 family protein [Bryobacterales bacterium]
MPLIQNDAVALGILFIILGLVFTTSASPRPFWKRFYGVVPSILVCYFLPGLLGTVGILDAKDSQLYSVSSRFLLPTSLVLFTLAMDVPAILRLGPKMLIMFFAGTLGVILGGPLAILLVSWINPAIVGGAGPDAAWRGLATIAGSWIGGSANQAAMKEVTGVSDALFAACVAVDVLVANLWMACLLFGASRSSRIDRLTGADASAVENLRDRLHAFEQQHRRIPPMKDVMQILAIGFGATAIGHLSAEFLAPWFAQNFPGSARFSLTSSFFWLVVVVTALGIAASFTRLRELEGAGASRIASILLYVLIAVIGMRMDLAAVFAQSGLFLVGLIWISIHAIVMLTVGYFIKAPFFFVAVGSQANIGGAASAPVVAAAFDPALAPAGVLMAVLGYAIGTYGGILSALLMQQIAP